MTDHLGLAGMAKNADRRDVEPSGVDKHKTGGAPSVVGAAPGLAEGTAGIKPASGAESAAAVKLEAFEPRAYGKGMGRKPHCKARPGEKSRCRRQRASVSPRLHPRSPDEGECELA